MVIVAQDHAGDKDSPLSGVLVDALWQLGVREAYGVCGREIAAVWYALLESKGTAREIVTMHTRHENGAGYAAYGSWAQSGRPVCVYVTTGPGLANVLASLETARRAGAKIVLLSPLTPAADRGRLGIQDTSPRGFRSPEFYDEGRLFDLVTTLEAPAELQTIIGQLAMGLSGAGAFMAHIAVPTTLQEAPVGGELIVPVHRRAALGVSRVLADEIVALLAGEPFAVVVGWGARAHAAKIRRLLDLTGAPVVSSPRGLGIADCHEQFLGVIGNGGRDGVYAALDDLAPHRLLVLGSGLGEATTRWRPELVRPGGFIHVDHDATVFARAYPHARTLAVQADIGEFLDAVLERGECLPRHALPARPVHRPRITLVPSDGERPVHPAALMAAIQRMIVDTTEMNVVADAATAMFLGARHLRFGEPRRWLVENRFGALGGAAAAVVGVAQASGGPALAIVGDGALHMQDELNTASHYGIPAIWVVLNDSGLGIVRYGMEANGWPNHDADYPETDFAAVARAKGVSGIRVTCEQQLDAALRRAVNAGGPFVIDVVIDRAAPPPIGARAGRR